MSFVLDTNVAIQLREGDDRIEALVKALNGAVYFSILTCVELEGGIDTIPTEAAVRRMRIDALNRAFPSLQFGERDLAEYRSTISHSGYSRRKLIDRLIGAQAKAIGATLVTLNPHDFHDIPNLKVLAW